MTNTKFRKRALLSSVAMLLVALVALGSATFAWFMDDPNAKADGINAKAQASTGLLIATDSTGLVYKKTAPLGKVTNSTDDLGVTLAPATTANGKDYFFVKAAKIDEYKAETNPAQKWQSVDVNNHTNNSGVYMEKMYLKRTGSVPTGKTAALTLKNVALTTTGPMASAAKIMVVNETTNEVVWTFTTGDAPAKWTTLSTATNYSDPPTGSTWTKTNVGNGINLAAGSFTPAVNEIKFNVYIWLDGNNTTVYSNNAINAADIITNLDFDFAVADPA